MIWWIILAMALTLALGFIKILRAFNSLNAKLKFVEEFGRHLHDYLDSNGKNMEAYNMMIHKSEKMQNQLGSSGLISYKPPWANFMHTNYAIILNLIPEMRMAFDQRLSAQGAMAQMITDTLNRHLGVVSELMSSRMSELKNPMCWFRSGVGTLVESPAQILYYFNIIPEGFLRKIEKSTLYKVITGSALLLGGIVALLKNYKELTSLLP